MVDGCGSSAGLMDGEAMTQVHRAFGISRKTACKIFYHPVGTGILTNVLGTKYYPCVRSGHFAIGVPEGIRTPDLRFRKPLLYPAELPGRARSL